MRASRVAFTAAAPSSLRPLPCIDVRRQQRASTLIARAATVSTNDFKNGLTVEIDGVPFKVVGEWWQTKSDGAALCAPPRAARRCRRPRARTKKTARAAPAASHEAKKNTIGGGACSRSARASVCSPRALAQPRHPPRLPPHPPTPPHHTHPTHSHAPTPTKQTKQTHKTEFLHVKPGKGAAFVRSKLKNLLTGNSNERTFRAGEMLNLAEVMRREGQFTYAEGDNYVFMDTDSYEETRLPKDDWAKYLKEGTTCTLVFYNGKVLFFA